MALLWRIGAVTIRAKARSPAVVSLPSGIGWWIFGLWRRANCVSSWRQPYGSLRRHRLFECNRHIRRLLKALRRVFLQRLHDDGLHSR